MACKTRLFLYDGKKISTTAIKGDTLLAAVLTAVTDGYLSGKDFEVHEYDGKKPVLYWNGRVRGTDHAEWWANQSQESRETTVQTRLDAVAADPMARAGGKRGKIERGGVFRGGPFRSGGDTPEHRQWDALTEEKIKRLSREEAIKFLTWNDHNGAYTDEDAEAEGFDPMTVEDARNLLLEQWRDSRDASGRIENLKQEYEDRGFEEDDNAFVREEGDGELVVTTIDETLPTSPDAPIIVSAFVAGNDEPILALAFEDSGAFFASLDKADE